MISVEKKAEVVTIDQKNAEFCEQLNEVLAGILIPSVDRFEYMQKVLDEMWDGVVFRDVSGKAWYHEVSPFCTNDYDLHIVTISGEVDG